MNSFKRYYGASFIFRVILLLLNVPLIIHSEIHAFSNGYNKNLSSSLVELISPTDGEIIQSNTTVRIQWKTNNFSGKISIYYSENNGSYWINIARDINASQNFYEWSVPEISSNKCLIRITTIDQNPNASSTSGLFSIKNYNTTSNRIWGGSIPFLQPFNTTDYYGSGDVDLNGIVNSEDINQINLIIAGQSQQVIRADINGDGLINSDDVNLLNVLLNGGILPGWWNKLPTREEKISWLKKMLAIDKVDEHPYIVGSYECYNFATQLYHNFTGYNEFSSRYFSSQTKFNIPVYYVFINPPSGESHYVNAVLVGDNPLVLTDWAFIEPQTDEIIYPGLGYTSVNTTLYIISLPGTYQVIFRLNQNDNWELQKRDENFIYRRPDLLPSTINNKPFLWHPKAVSDDLIICERSSDDMNRNYDICFIKTDSDTFSSTNTKYFYSDLISTNNTIVTAQDGGDDRIYLIWKGEVDLQRKTFFGIINKKDFRLESYQEENFLNNTNAINSISTTQNKVVFYWKIETSKEESNGIYWAEVNENGVLCNPLFIRLNESLTAELLDYKVIYNSKNEPIVYYSSANYEYIGHIRYYDFRINRKKILTTDNNLDTLWILPNPNFYWFIQNNNNDVGYLTAVLPKAPYCILYNKEVYESSFSERVSSSVINWCNIYQMELLQDSIYFIGNEPTQYGYTPFWFSYNNNKPNPKNYIDIPIGNTSSNFSSVNKNGKLLIAWEETSDKLKTLNYFILKSNQTPVQNSGESLNGFNLLQNYPNPFNSSTVIKYSVPYQSKVIIKIYDILGREVKTIFSEEKPKGEYTARFDASDEESELSSGIYLCRLTINPLEYGKAFDKSIKLVLIK